MIAFFSLPLASFVALAFCAALTFGFVAPRGSRRSREAAPCRRPMLIGVVSLAVPIALLGVLLIVVRTLFD